VGASNFGITSVDCAVGVIVATNSHIKGGGEATSNRVAHLISAHVAIVARMLLVNAETRAKVTRVVGTEVSVVAVLGGGVAFAVSLAALIDHAINRWAGDTKATIACLSRVLAA